MACQELYSIGDHAVKDGALVFTHFEDRDEDILYFIHVQNDKISIGSKWFQILRHCSENVTCPVTWFAIVDLK